MPVPPDDTQQAIEADTDIACARTHSAGGWTQLLYQSHTWRTLAPRADARDPDAWTDIANLVAWNHRHVDDTPCTADMVDDLQATASRLSEPSR